MLTTAAASSESTTASRQTAQYSANGASHSSDSDSTYEVPAVSVDEVPALEMDTVPSPQDSHEDPQFNWDHTRYDHHEKTEPLRYDPEAIAEHYGRRPFQVLGRVISIFWPMLTFAFAIFWDKQTGRLERNERTRAIQVRELVTRLGPAYIKVGQALSTRPDLLPSVYLDEFTRLQDQIPPFSNELAFQFIEEELGQAPDQIYAELSDKPIAAATLGQE